MERLRLLAVESGDRAAVQVQGGAGRNTVTHAALLAEVEACAAGLARAGLHAGQAVVAAMPLTVESVVLQHAVRTVGATLLWVHPRVDADQLASVIEDTPVRLVVTDHETRLAAWAGVDLGKAELLVVGDAGDGLERIMTLGREHLAEAPSHLHLLDSHADQELVRPRLLGVGGGPSVLSSSTRSTLVATDSVVVAGEMADAHVQDAIAQQLESGSTLVAVHTAEQLPLALAAFRPTVLRLGREVGDQLDAIVRTAEVVGRPWSETPEQVLGAVAKIEDLRRIPRGVRRRIAPAEALVGWFGGRLAELRLEGEASGEMRALSRLLGQRCVVRDLPAIEAVELLPGGQVVWGDPADLPRRGRRKTRAAAFTIGATPRAADAELPSLPLFGGESMLDQLLRSQQVDA